MKLENLKQKGQLREKASEQQIKTEITFAVMDALGSIGQKKVLKKYR